MTDDRPTAPREDGATSSHDDVIDRLAKADPAASVEASEIFLANLIARAVADPAKEIAPVVPVVVASAPIAQANEAPEASEAPPSKPEGPNDPDAPADGEPSAVLDLTAARNRRRPRWYQAASAAVVAGLVGVGGYALGAQGEELRLVEGGAVAPIALSGGGVGTSGANTEIAAADAERQSSYPGSLGHHTFTSSGLSTQGRAAPAYTFDSSSVTMASLEALAATFGVTGSAEVLHDIWLVGQLDGVSPTVAVDLNVSPSFHFSNPALNPWSCEVIDLAAVEGGEDGATSDSPSFDPCLLPVPAPTPSEERAIEALKGVLEAMGRDLAGYEFTSETWEGSPTRLAHAWIVVDGHRTDQAISAAVVEAGIVSASGPLAPLVSLGDYPVVSEQEAFERLADPRFGVNQTSGQPQEEPGTVPGEPVEPPTAPPTTPRAGTALAWPITTIDITQARLGLTSSYQPGGTVLIVPAYEFTAAGGGTWSVIAVADERLDVNAE